MVGTKDKQIKCEQIQRLVQIVHTTFTEKVQTTLSIYKWQPVVEKTCHQTIWVIPSPTDSHMLCCNLFALFIIYLVHTD